MAVAAAVGDVLELLPQGHPVVGLALSADQCVPEVGVIYYGHLEKSSPLNLLVEILPFFCGLISNRETK